jgi:hypothetical protein
LWKQFFETFFRGKFKISPTFLGKNFTRNFPRNFPRKKCTKKSAPGADPTTSQFRATFFDGLPDVQQINLLFSCLLPMKREDIFFEQISASAPGSVAFACARGVMGREIESRQGGTLKYFRLFGLMVGGPSQRPNHSKGGLRKRGTSGYPKTKKKKKIRVTRFGEFLPNG